MVSVRTRDSWSRWQRAIETQQMAAPSTERCHQMFVVFGIILVVAGAILAFAVNAAVENVDLVTIGWILMVGGAVSLIAGAVRGASFMSTGKQKFTTERHMSPDGQHYVEETTAS